MKDCILSVSVPPCVGGTWGDIFLYLCTTMVIHCISVAMLPFSGGSCMREESHTGKRRINLQSIGYTRGLCATGNEKSCGNLAGPQKF